MIGKYDNPLNECTEMVIDGIRFTAIETRTDGGTLGEIAYYHITSIDQQTTAQGFTRGNAWRDLLYLLTKPIDLFETGEQ